jgi:hypothetical protein
MRRNVLVAVLLGACISSLAFAGDDRCASSAEAIPLCTVLSDAAKYDGKEITVRGLYRMVLHGSVLTSPECGKTYVNMRQASDYKGDRDASAIMRSLTKKDQFQSVDVVIRGTFRVAKQGQCFGQNCLSYEIEDHELLCAQAPKAEAGTTTNNEAGHAQRSNSEK